MSDDSSDEDIRVRTGQVPLSWYDDQPFLGYDVHGKRVPKLMETDTLDSQIMKSDDPQWWRVITDHLNAKQVRISDELLGVIRDIRNRKPVGKGVNPYVDYDLTVPKQQFPLYSDAPVSKRRFEPSKWEKKQVIKIAKALEKGLLKPKKKKTEEIWDLWADEAGEEKPAPHKRRLPGHVESYNPPNEYLLTPEEEEEWREKDPMNREMPFLPQKFPALRKVPGYDGLLQESYERCLDLFLAPRVVRPKINVNPDSLLPELPDPEDFRPFPESLGMTFKGLEGRVLTFSFSSNVEFLAAGDSEGNMCVWEVMTGKTMHRLKFDKKVYAVAFNPVLPLLGISTGNTVIIQDVPGYDSVKFDVIEAEESWTQDENRIEVNLRKTVHSMAWHGKGDFFATLCKREALSKKIAIHCLSKRKTMHIFSRKSKGDVKAVAFHPTRPLFFVATEKNVLTYNLKDQVLVKKFVGANVPVSVHVHSSGEHIMAACEDTKLLWYDYDASTAPFKTLVYHKASLTSVHTHRKYPLMASSGRDKAIYLFHAQVYQDYMQSPTVLPIKTIRTHGVPTNLLFHPKQPWLAVAVANEVQLYV